MVGSKILLIFMNKRMSGVNIFRPEYKELSEADKKHIDDVKNKASELFHLFPKDGLRGINREVAVAITKLEESVMWAVKGMTK